MEQGLSSDISAVSPAGAVTCLNALLLLIPAQKTKGTGFPDLLALAPWKRPYQARLPIGGKAACGPGNSTRKVGSNEILPMPWA
jgi:hypothetical protein